MTHNVELAADVCRKLRMDAPVLHRGLPKGSKRLPKGYQKGAKRLPKRYQNGTKGLHTDTAWRNRHLRGVNLVVDFSTFSLSLRARALGGLFQAVRPVGLQAPGARPADVRAGPILRDRRLLQPPYRRSASAGLRRNSVAHCSTHPTCPPARFTALAMRPIRRAAMPGFATALRPRVAGTSAESGQGWLPGQRRIRSRQGSGPLFATGRVGLFSPTWARTPKPYAAMIRS